MARTFCGEYCESHGNFAIEIYSIRSVKSLEHRLRLPEAFQMHRNFSRRFVTRRRSKNAVILCWMMNYKRPFKTSRQKPIIPAISDLRDHFDKPGDAPFKALYQFIFDRFSILARTAAWTASECSSILRYIIFNSAMNSC